MQVQNSVGAQQNSFVDQPRSPSGIGRSFLLILGCFFLSGFAALLYEVVWLRQFAIIFGTSEFALAVVLSAYLAGLSVGAAIAGRFVHRVQRPVLTYAILELVVAVAALAVPIALSSARILLVALFGGQEDPTDAGSALQLLFIIASTFVIIMIPTGAMGATLPLLTRHAVRHESEVGGRVGLLYTINTLGAVLGILVAAFVLLPACGMVTTMLVGVFVNLMVFLLAVFAVRLVRARDAGVEGNKEGIDGPNCNQVSSLQTEDRVRPLLGKIVRPVILFSGAVSFGWEIIWTRLLAHVLGGSIFAFATMLSSFLLGILIGSGIASRWATTRRRAANGLAICQLGIALSSFAVFHQIGSIAEWGRLWGSSGSAGLWTNATLAMSVLLPSTLFIGATFPFAVRLYTETYQQAASSTAQIYAWNTAGSIAGSLLTGLWLLPQFGFALTATIAISISLLLALVLTLLRTEGGMRLLGFVAAGILLVILFPPQRPDSILRMSPFVYRDHEGDPLYAGVGRSATVHLSEGDGFFFLRTNGLPEATIPARGAIARITTEEMLSLLPNLARPDAKSMLVIGLGGGLALDAVPPSIDEVDVFELEPKVVEANQKIAGRRDRDFLADPRIRIVCNDARGGLALTNKKYDVIVSQPSHPWTAGASHLYTRQFMEEVRGHLNRQGVFAQWIDINFVDPHLLKSLGATLLDVFPFVRLYRPAEDSLVFLASTDPLALEEAIARPDHPVSRASDFYRQRGLDDVHNAAAMLTFDRQGLVRYCEDASLNTDNSNRLATRSVQAMSSAEKKKLDEALSLHDALLDPDGLRKKLNLNAGYLAQLLHDNQQTERARDLLQSIKDEDKRLIAQARYDLHRGKYRECAETLDVILEKNPESLEALQLRALLSIAKPSIAKRFPVSDAIRSKVDDPTQAVIEGFSHARKKDWDAVASLDSRLSLATPQDACFAYALLLRIRWRNESEEALRADEALHLLRQATPISHRTMFLLPWARAGLLADEDAIVLGAVEKRIRIAKGIKKNLTPSARIKFVAKHESILDQINDPEPDVLRRIATARAQLQSLLR